MFKLAKIIVNVGVSCMILVLLDGREANLKYALEVVLCMGLSLIVNSWGIGWLYIIKSVGRDMKGLFEGECILKYGSIIGALISLTALFAFLVKCGGEVIAVNEADVALSSVLALSIFVCHICWTREEKIW